MKNALIAIDPLALKGRPFEHLCGMVQLFQEKGLFSRTSVVSVVQPSQFSMPYSYYRKRKGNFAHEAMNNLRNACHGKFQFVTAQVLQSNSDANEELVELLSKHSKHLGAELLVTGSSDRKGLPYWFLGSLSETASLAAKMPVLVIKHVIPTKEFLRSMNFLVGVDVATPPSARDINWIVGLAKTANARVHLVYVSPLKRPFVDRLQQRKGLAEAMKILGGIQRKFEVNGIPATSSIKMESRSVAHTLVDFAEKRNALLTIVTTAKRSRVRKQLLGSTARHTLALTKRPFLSLRMD